MRRLLLALLAVLVLSGCGVPEDEQPRPLTARDLPFALPTPTRLEDPVGSGRVALYFVRDGQVVLSTRPVQASTPTPELLELLFAGTTPDEQQAGLLSTIPASLVVEDVEVQGRTAVVTLAGPDDAARPQALAYAQIVATLTPNRVDGVRFRRDGADLAVPRGDGSLTAAPVDRDDYAELLALPATAAPSPSA